MKDTSVISVVTPIYNGAPFIKDAYDCLCRQSYNRWEWVVVDDGSTDETQEQMREIGKNDKRISYTHQHNSGAAKLPRDRAVYQAKGSFILPLDIDDLIDDSYLEQMFSRMQETSADIVYPKMVFIDKPSGNVTKILPVANFDTSQVYEGRQLVKETMPDWNIGCNGGLYRKQVWSNLLYWPEEHEPIWVYSDEVDERHYLLQAKRVAFANACYFYQNHDQSITHQVSAKRFHILKTNGQLLELAKEEFGRHSEEYRRANLKVFYGWRSMMAYYLKHHHKLTDADGQIQIDLQKTFNSIDPTMLSRKERLKFLNLTNGRLLQILFAIKYRPSWLLEKLMQRLSTNYHR